MAGQFAELYHTKDEEEIDQEPELNALRARYYLGRIDAPTYRRERHATAGRHIDVDAEISAIDLHRQKRRAEQDKYARQHQDEDEPPAKWRKL